MGLSFFETMAGELTDAQGAVHPVRFEIKCEAPKLRRFLVSGRAKISGVVQAGPWAEQAVVEGALHISPLRGRSLVYDLSFFDEEGRAFQLVGQKDLRLHQPVTSMTHLRVRLLREGAEVATGFLDFDLKDLPSFSRSWSTFSTLPVADLEGPVAASLPVAGPPRGLMLAYAEAVIEPGAVVPAVDAQTIDHALHILAHLPPHLRGLVSVGLRSLNVAARARYGRGFQALTVARRRALLARVEGAGGQGLLLLLGLPIKTAHFSRPDYLNAVGISTEVATVREPEPGWLEQVLTPELLDEPVTRVPCDVVVIGTGAGGGAVAATLAEAGLAVAMVEEGDLALRRDLQGPASGRLLRYWRSAGIQPTLGNTVCSVPTGRSVGGTTTINSGTCFDTPVGVLEAWRARGLPEDFEPERFQRWLEPVNQELGVAPGDRPWLGEIASVVARGAEALRARGVALEHGPLPRNAPGCDGQGQCVLGCPTEAKRSSNVSWVPRALDAGATLFTGQKVTRLLRRGKRVVGLIAEGRDASGARRSLQIDARAVVVSAGTLNSPRLLADSDVHLPRLGKGLSIHPALGVFARFERSLGAPWRAIPQSYGMHGPLQGEVRFEGFYAPPSVAGATLPFQGPALTDWMESWDRVGQFGLMVRDGNHGAVRRGPHGEPLIHYDITPRVLHRLTEGASMLVELMLLGGAAEVATGIHGVGTVRSVEEARAIAGQRLSPRDFRVMGFHPLGTCAMGASPADGVVDFEHRVYGTENLYVVDGSSVPSSLGVNPQITIMAMALRAGEGLARRLG